MHMYLADSLSSLQLLFRLFLDTADMDQIIFEESQHYSTNGVFLNF